MPAGKAGEVRRGRTMLELEDDMRRTASGVCLAALRLGGGGGRNLAVAALSCPSDVSSVGTVSLDMVRVESELAPTALASLLATRGAGARGGGGLGRPGPCRSVSVKDGVLACVSRSTGLAGPCLRLVGGGGGSVGFFSSVSLASGVAMLACATDTGGCALSSVLACSSEPDLDERAGAESSTCAGSNVSFSKSSKETVLGPSCDCDVAPEGVVGAVFASTPLLSSSSSSSVEASSSESNESGEPGLSCVSAPALGAT